MCKLNQSALCLILAVLMLLSTGCQAFDSAGEALAQPEYPVMADYPDEYGNGYEAWRDSHQAQYDQPAGYADTLDAFFLTGIPTFLSDSSSDNAVCSPVNIYMALSMLAEISGDNSRQQILNELNAPDISALRTQAGHVWNAHYCADGATSTVLANSLWFNAGMAYNTDLVQLLADHYYAATYQGALGSEEMNRLLRQWLNDQTGGLLEEQAQNVTMDPQTVLTLASTVLYRAKWNGGFQEENNTEDVFHAPTGDTTVTYMNKTLQYGPYFWGADFGAAYLSLEDGSRMWLILPYEGKTPADILSSGHAMEMILGDTASYKNQERIQVHITLPKFDIVSDVKLEEKLQNLGITDVFDQKAADFTPILPSDPAWLSSARHAARVAIDEEGITAAAYTVMMMVGAAPPPKDEVDFVLNRPFLFVITSRDNLPLFAGIVNQP